MLEQNQKGKQLGKAFNAIGWESIVKRFNEKTNIQYESCSSTTQPTRKHGLRQMMSLRMRDLLNDVDQDSHSNFMESFNTTIVSDASYGTFN